MADDGLELGGSGKALVRRDICLRSQVETIARSSN
jgi:hypothetical protein